MKTTLKSSARRLGVAVVLSGLTFLAGGSNALGAVLSDELLVTSPTGAVAADIVIPEGGAPATEPSALYAPTTTLTGPVPAGGLVAAGLIPPGGIPGASFVILSEPPGEPVDPSELPPVIFIGPNGPVVVSDLIVSGFAGANTPFISFISDNNPDLAAAVATIPAGAAVPILRETGLLQDVSFSTAGAFPGFKVEVRSDISVPEPSSLVILLGFAGVGAIGSIWRRRRLAA